jgi:hypothetical protein
VGFQNLIKIGLFTHLLFHFYHFTQKTTKVTKTLEVPNEGLQSLEKLDLLPPETSKYFHPTFHFIYLFLQFHGKFGLKFIYSTRLCASVGFLKETHGYLQLVETPVMDIHGCSN